ncbi:hypothetical protein [Sphingomonas pseudosanguinis]|uniref:hypothetical protein n=1 Tax=Sphingomonas pseudosanguinis TaxID=413712 RepID=UPI001C842A6A|nr:hypothetical protein [Sphingomonas pseudosanguinis]
MIAIEALQAFRKRRQLERWRCAQVSLAKCMIAFFARKIDELAVVLIVRLTQRERAFQASSPKNFHGWSSDQPFFWLCSGHRSA